MTSGADASGLRARVLTVGDNVVDRYPDLGVMYPGGNAVNVAVNVRRLGAHSAYLGVLGTDRSGEVVRDALVAEGVDTGLLRVVDGPNAYATVRVVDGNRVFESGEVGVSAFRLTEADFGVVGAYDVVHTGECSMTEEDLPGLRARARLLSFDFSERPWDYLEAYARYPHVAVVSSPDGGDAQTAAELGRRVLALGPDLVAVTMGALGAVVVDRAGASSAPAGQGPVVDTLGAGDAFIARLLVGLAGGERRQEVVVAATSFATATCAAYGAFGYETPLVDADDPAAPRSTEGSVSGAAVH